MPDGSPAAGATVTVSGGGVSKTTKTDSQGYYEVTLSVSSVPISVTVKASKDHYTGSASAHNVEGAVKIDVYLKAPPPTKKSTYLKIGVNGTVFPVNSTVKVYGNISPAMSVNIEIVIKNPIGKTRRTTVKSNTLGLFSYTFKVDVPGKWSIYAYFKGSSKYSSSKSNTITIYVKYSISINAWAKTSGRNITVYGKIEPPSGGVTVMIYVSIDGGKTWLYLGNATTREDGSFEKQFEVRVYGNILFKVVVPETETTVKAEVKSPLATQLMSPREKELERQVSRLLAEKETLEEKLSNATTRIESLESELESVKGELSKVLSENKDLKAELSKVKTQLEDLSAKYSKLREESSKLRLLLYTAIPLSLIGGLVAGYFIGRKKAKKTGAEKKTSSTKSE